MSCFSLTIPCYIASGASATITDTPVSVPPIPSSVTYSVTVTDAAGATAPASTVVYVVPPSVTLSSSIAAGTTLVGRATDTLTATPTSGPASQYTYTWTGPTIPYVGGGAADCSGQICVLTAFVPGVNNIGVKVCIGSICTSSTIQVIWEPYLASTAQKTTPSIANVVGLSMEGAPAAPTAGNTTSAINLSIGNTIAPAEQSKSSLIANTMNQSGEDAPAMLAEQAANSIVNISVENGAAHGVLAPIATFTPSCTPTGGTGLFTMQGNYWMAGNYVMENIFQPISVVSAPTGYVYVLSQPAGTSQTYLFVMRPIPSGYYNLSNYQPGMVVSANSLSVWNSEWQNYWGNTILQQSSSLYITKIYLLSTTTSTGYFGAVGNQYSAYIQSFSPTAMTTDYAGDVFFVGKTTSGITGCTSCVELIVFNAQTGDFIANDIPLSSFGSVVPTELAASPDGTVIYTASTANGAVYLYTVNAGGAITNAGLINLAYADTQSSAATENALDISQFINNVGGPYRDKSIITGNAGAQYGSYKDITSFHHPVYLTDYEGVLYVIDNWTWPLQFFSVRQCGSSINAKGVQRKQC